MNVYAVRCPAALYMQMSKLFCKRHQAESRVLRNMTTDDVTHTSHMASSRRVINHGPAKRRDVIADTFRPFPASSHPRANMRAIVHR